MLPGACAARAKACGALAALLAPRSGARLRCRANSPICAVAGGAAAAAAAYRRPPLVPRAPRQHGTTAAQAVPLGLIASAADVIYEPTGVPLVDELMKMSSVRAAAQHSLHLLALLAVTAVAGSLLLRVLGSAAGRRFTGRGKQFNLGAAVLSSALQPCQTMLPVFCTARAATVALALLEVAATKWDGYLSDLCSRAMGRQWLAGLNWLVLAAGGGGGGPEIQALDFLHWLTQLVQDCSELVLIVTCAWAAWDLKNRLIRRQVEAIQTDADPHNDGAVSLLRLLSSGLSIVIVLAALGVTLVGFGFHIGPLMASVGGVGVVLGLATQDLLQNIGAAVSLYCTRPFVQGDEVQFVNPDGVEVQGVVLNIEPTRTILRDADSGCVVHVSNSDISQFIIKNYTQCRNLRRLEELQAAARGEGHPALMTMTELTVEMRSDKPRPGEGWDGAMPAAG